MWYARAERTLAAGSDLAGLARGVKMLDESGDAAAALPLVSAAGLGKTDVAEYARYYRGIALQRLNRPDEADAAFAAVATMDAPSSLPEAALFRQAEIREARNDYRRRGRNLRAIAAAEAGLAADCPRQAGRRGVRRG